MDLSIIPLVEGLVCGCVKNEQYAKINDCIELMRFAKATGSELYLSSMYENIFNKLEPFMDFLKGGKYELGFNAAGKHFIENLFEFKLTKPLTHSNGYICNYTFDDYLGTDKYFLCKRDCPLCKNTSRGCPLHCCIKCWTNISKLDKISKTIELIPVIKVCKTDLKKFITLINRDPTINSGGELNPSKGYLHNNLDIVLYMMKNWVISNAQGVKLLKDLIDNY